MTKRFIRTTSTNFNKLSDKSEYKDSIVFIEDINLIWSNGVYYVYIPEKGVDYFNEEDKQEFINNIKDKLSASDISYDGSSLNENIIDVDFALNFALTKSRTISDTNNIIPLTTKITNIIFNNSDNINLSFSYSGQNECTIVIYNKTGNSITLPTSFIIDNYKTILVNKITSVTLLDKTSCEISILFTNNECRILTIV